MQDFSGKVAFVTGAASGIGLALTKALKAQGCHVMMADIDGDNLIKASNDLPNDGGRISTAVCDVRSLEAVQAAAEKTVAEFGKVHLVFNNAGVALAGNPGEIEARDWQWIVDINLMGVVYGVETFVPLMREHGEGGYVFNTASMAGHVTMAGMAPYHATKFAVVGYSEALKQELAPENIGVSVLCPTWVKTNIHNTGEERPSAVDGGVAAGGQLYEMVKGLVENGMSPDNLAELCLKSIQANRMYVFTDPETRIAIDMRRDAIQADYKACLEDLGIEI